jgi:hypothetical protein
VARSTVAHPASGGSAPSYAPLWAYDWRIVFFSPFLLAVVRAERLVRRLRSRLGQRAGMSPERQAARDNSQHVVELLSLPKAGVLRGEGVARRPKFRAVLVAIDRLSLLIAHFRVAVERAPATLLPPPIEPQGHQAHCRSGDPDRRLRQCSRMTPERSCRQPPLA